MSTTTNIMGATMDNKLYNDAATPQLSAHDITKEALKTSIGRILDSFPPSKDSNSKIIRIADLGSAGGVNAIILLRYLESILWEKEEKRPVEYYFEDLPTSDLNELVRTINESNLSDQFYTRCIGKSFYEKLFPPDSVHLFLSYITLHWMHNCPDIKRNWKECNDDLKFVQPNEANVKSSLFEKFRSTSVANLILFLKLRADELHDNGEGLFLMVGGGSLGGNETNKEDPYGGRDAGFLLGPNGSIFREAFENAAQDPQYSHISKEIEQAHLNSCIYYFMRCESDVMESFQHVKDVLELKELKWENCPVKCGSSEKLTDFLWSIHGHALKESIKLTMNETNNAFEQKDLEEKVIDAVKSHVNNLTKRYFPEGQTTVAYMYMVVKRKQRNSR